MVSSKLASSSLPILGIVVLATSAFDAACHTASAQPAAAPQATAAAAPAASAAPVRLEPVGVVDSSARASFVSAKQRATLGLDPKEVRWSPAGLERIYNGGVQWFGADGTSFWHPGTPDARSQSLVDLLAMAGGVGSWVETADRGNGRVLTTANLGGQRHRVGMLAGGPTASIVLMVPTAPPHGVESRVLARSHGFKFAADGTPTNAVPDGATALPVEAPSAEQTAAAVKDLGSLRGAAVTVTWSTRVDLDRDGAKELALCVTGGKDSTDCYVLDEQQGQRRYYGLSAIKGKSGDTAAAPLPFQHGEGVYLMQAIPDRKVIVHVRWTGTEYEAPVVL